MNRAYQLLIFSIIAFWTSSPFIYAGLVLTGIVNTSHDWLNFWGLGAVSAFIVYKFLTLR